MMDKIVSVGKPKQNILIFRGISEVHQALIYKNVTGKLQVVHENLRATF